MLYFDGCQLTWYCTSILWSIDSCQDSVSADQYRSIVVNSIICWAKEARASIVLDIEWVQFVSHVGCFLGPAKLWKTAELSVYCAFHKHANSKVHKPPSQLRFSLTSIIITITSNEPWNKETHKTDRNPPITNHKPWPTKNAIVSWPLNFAIHMFVKSAVIRAEKNKFCPRSVLLKTAPHSTVFFRRVV